LKLSKGRRRTKELTECFLGHEIPHHLLQAFFAKTERGISPILTNTEDEKELVWCLSAFKMIAWHFNTWRDDFRTGLLFPQDFAGESRIMKDHALSAYRAAFSLTDTNYTETSIGLSKGLIAT